MCGRFTLTAKPQKLRQRFALAAAPEEFSPRYNIAPTQDVLVVANRTQRLLRPARWLFRLVDAATPVGAEGTEARVDQVEASLQVNPVAGFVMPDHLDESLEVFGVDGAPIGDGGRAWRMLYFEPEALAGAFPQFGLRCQIAIVSRPDADKGEVLVAVTNEARVTLEEIRGVLRAAGLPNICAPRELRAVREIPKLGTGKINHRGLAELLRQPQP